MSAQREVLAATFPQMPCDTIFLYDLCSILSLFNNNIHERGSLNADLSRMPT